MRTHGLHLCQECGQFTRAHSKECSFCGEQVSVATRSLSTKAKIGVVAAVFMLSLTPMVHCGAGAYGGPPACTATSGCTANEVCDCIHRALELQKQSIRERVIKVNDAEGLPFDHGRFQLVEEAWEEHPTAPSLDKLRGSLAPDQATWSREDLNRILAKIDANATPPGSH